MNVFYAIVGVAALYYGADFLVKGGVCLARKAGVSPLVIGLTLVAYATSAPELVVSVSAAWSGNADISLGNIVGSNIFNIAFILGLCACITPVSVNRQLLRFDAPVMVGTAILLTIFYFSAHGLNRIQGGVFLLGIIAYTVWSVYASKKEENEGNKELIQEAEEKENEEIGKKELSLAVSLGLIVLGFAALIFGAKIFLLSAVFFARLLHLSDAVIGLTIVAAGTSLPELATSVVAAIKKENDIAIGNVMGSNIFNILGILGITPIVSPLVNTTIDWADLGMMIFCSIALLPIMKTGWKISRKEGIFFLLIYCCYTAYLVLQHS